MDLLYFVVAQAGAAGDPGGGLLGLMLPMVIIFGIMYFLVIRPQSKKQREHENYLNNLKTGDKIVTQGGLMGRITNVDSNVLTLDLGDRVRVKVMRSHILGSQPKPSDEKSDKDEKK
jgi:preprotein translocase subunit YajC